DTKIIGIAGSYGKTTMKAVLQAVLGAKQAVLSAPESVNTPVGIARWILQQTAAPAVLILEMGEHYPGDVAKICRLARPDIAIITGINEAHLERMKSLERTAAAIFELAAGAKPGALVLLNGDDQLVMAHYKEYVWPDHQVKKFQISNFKSAVFDQANLAWQAKDAELGELTISLLGEYALGDAAAAIEAGRELGLDSRDIAAGISQIRPVAHRLQPIKSASGILVIDDAYNGNSAGASAAINALARFGGRRKLYITPGLVETGKAAAEVHQSIGRQLAQAANVVILIKNSVTPFIAEGIAEAKTATKIIWFDSAAEAHQNLKSILQPGDVIVFQNDWGDQYV
ncbi:MAG TPA: UDP-N-acetylmuramoyl-tripeptide--D-alanyl-D-alanine ligase, partial [Patescibacteria group bacterium]|nr:UDP-N-acetylmuramoyl-tripeptide--D-alanyl-D-alanine ligase [Patescibacteria group bacterium]